MIAPDFVQTDISDAVGFLGMLLIPQSKLPRLSDERKKLQTRLYYYACHEYWCKYRTMYLYVLRFEFNDITKMFRRDIQGCLNIHNINWQETTPFRMNCSHPAMLIHWMSCPRSAGKARKVARCLTIVWTQLLAMMIGKDRQCPYFSSNHSFIGLFR